MWVGAALYLEYIFAHGKYTLHIVYKLIIIKFATQQYYRSWLAFHHIQYKLIVQFTSPHPILQWVWLHHETIDWKQLKANLS